MAVTIHGTLSPPRVTRGPSRQETDQILTYYRTGNLAAAAPLAKALTEQFPDHPFAWKALGTISWQTGQFQDAVTALQQTVRLAPNDAEAHNTLGNALRDLGCLTEAEARYREAIRLRPGYAKAVNNLGNALADLGRLAEAEAGYREAIRLKPDYAEACSNLGNVLKDLGRLTEAEQSYREAIRLKSGYAEAYSNLGNALKDLGRLAEAEASYREAIRLNPDDAIVHSNLGNAARDLGRLTEAEQSYREAIRLKPDYAEAYSNLGTALGDSGRSQEAEASYQEALRLKPGYAKAHSNLLLNLNYSGSVSVGAALCEAQQYGAVVSAQAVPKFTSWNSDPGPATVRIGFVSGDFRNHPVGYFLEGMLNHLDPDRFALYAFPTTPKGDDLTARIKPLFREWIPLYGKNDPDAASTIHQLGIDILIDLSGHTAHNRLPVFAHKPAPLQVSWLGYFATTGLPEMDCFLGDPHLSPISEQQHFTEKICNLPETWLCFTPPGQPVPILPLPALSNGYVTFGCCGNLAKMGSEVVTVWSALLQRIPDAKLFLKAKQLADATVRAEVVARFARHGITENRLFLEGPSSRREYFESYNRIDLALDTFPYPGGTTSAEALWMGVPVLTMTGDRFLSRLGESIAMNSGQAGWIAKDRDDFVGKAVAFASDLQQLSDVRATLRERVLHTPLFDTVRFAENFGATLWGMYQRHKCAAS